MIGLADASGDDGTNTENGQLDQVSDEHCCVLVSRRFCSEGIKIEDLAGNLEPRGHEVQLSLSHSTYLSNPVKRLKPPDKRRGNTVRTESLSHI